LVIGFTEHLLIVTKSNYNTLANICTRLLTTEQFAFTSRFLVTDRLLASLLAGECLTTESRASLLGIKHPSEAYDQNFITVG
jgi:hypothetical protein